MKHTLVILTVLGLLNAGAQARPFAEIKKSGTIRIATEGAFPPFNYMAAGKLSGFEVELAEHLARQLGLKVQWITQPFDLLFDGLSRDRYDIVIAGHGITAKRASVVSFTKPHYCTGGVIVTRRGGPKTAGALAGKTVTVQLDTTYLKRAKTLAGLRGIQSFAKDSDAQAALLSGRADAWIGDKFAGLELVKKHKGTLEQGGLLFYEHVGMAVKKGNNSLLSEVNKALSKALTDGSYLKISEKYFDEDIRCRS